MDGTTKVFQMGRTAGQWRHRAELCYLTKMDVESLAVTDECTNRTETLRVSLNSLKSICIVKVHRDHIYIYKFNLNPGHMLLSKLKRAHDHPQKRVGRRESENTMRA